MQNDKHISVFIKFHKHLGIMSPVSIFVIGSYPEYLKISAFFSYPNTNLITMKTDADVPE